MKKITLFIASLFVVMASFAEVKLEKLWEASSATDPASKPAWMTNNDCRDMAVFGDYLYVVTKDAQSLRVIDLTAENMADAVANATELKLSGDLTTINSLGSTGGDYSKLYGCSFASKNLVVVEIDPTTGETFEVLKFTETGADGRFDYFNVSMDMNRYTTTIYAALSNGKYAYRWEGNQMGMFPENPDTIALPAALGGSAIVAPAIAPEDDYYSGTMYDAVFLMSQSTDPAYWEFLSQEDPDTWELTTTVSNTPFPANTFTAQGDNTASGAVSCEFAGKKILISTLGRLGGFEIIDYTDGVASATKLSVSATATLGSNANTTVTSPIVVRQITADSIHVFQCSPNNGIVAYALYNHVQPIVASTIAELKEVKEKGAPVTLKSADGKGFQLTFEAEMGMYIQDATGAIALSDPYGNYLTNTGNFVDNIVGKINYTFDAGWQKMELPGIYVEGLDVIDDETETITFAEPTVDQILADEAKYEYYAVEFKDVDIFVNDKGESYIKGSTDEATLTLYGGYTYEAFPSKATLRGYYGEHPYGPTYGGNVFYVVDMEFDEVTLENVTTKAILLHNRFAIALTIDGTDLVISTDESRIPTNLKTIVGYASKALDYYYDANGNEVSFVKDVFVSSEFTYSLDTIKNFTATVGTFQSQSAKYIDRNGVNTVLQTSYGKVIPAAGDIIGYDYYTYDYDADYNQVIAPAFWVESSKATAYSYISEYKNMVSNGQVSEEAATITEPMIVNYVESSRSGQATVYAYQMQGTTVNSIAIRLQSNDKNIKSGDEIKNVKGRLTKFQYDATDKVITTGTYIDVNPMDNTIEVVSSGNPMAAPASLSASSYYFGQSAINNESKYIFINKFGEIKAVDNDGITEYYFFYGTTDSIQVVAYDFALTEDHVGACAIKGIFNACNNGPVSYIILTKESDILTAETKFASIADLKAGAVNITGISYGLENPVLLTYVQNDSTPDYNSWPYVYYPNCHLYVQDATGAIRITLDTLMFKNLTVVPGDSIFIAKGNFDSYNKALSIDKSHNTTIVAKNSNNPLVAKVLTVDEFKAGSYDAMLVKFENVEFVKGKHPQYPNIDRYFFYQNGKTLGEVGPADWDERGFSQFEFYPFNDIVAIATNGSWMGANECKFFPIGQDSIKDVTPVGSAIAYMCKYDEVLDVTYTGLGLTTIQTERGVIIQDASYAAILLDGIDSIPVGKQVTNMVGKYYPADENCMARFVATSLEVGAPRRPLSYAALTIDELFANMAQHEGEVVEMAFTKTERLADGKYVVYTTDSTAITVVGDVIPQDSKLQGAFYRIAKESDSILYVTGFKASDYGRYNVIMFHDLSDWANYRSDVEKTSYYDLEGFTSPVLLNSVYSGASQDKILNVQQTKKDGTIVSATIEARGCTVDFQPGDSIYNIAGLHYGFEEEITSYWHTLKGRHISAARYDIDKDDYGYPEDKEPLEGGYYPTHEVELGSIIKRYNSGNALSATEMTDITPLLGAAESVPYQGQRFKVTGTIVVDTTFYEDFDGVKHYEYDTQIKVGEKTIGLIGKDVKIFAGKEVSLIGTLDLGFAVENKRALYVADATDVLIDAMVVKNIAEFINFAHPTAVVTIASEVAVTYQNKANIYVQDETGSLLIYDNKNNFENGDCFTGLKGTFKDYNGTPEMVNATFPEVVKGATVLPTILNIENLDNADLNSYVVLHNVEFFEGLAFSSVKENNRYATVSKVYTIPTDSTPTLDTVNATVYNSYLVADTIAANTKVSVVGIVAQYNGARQIAYISNAPYVAPVAPEAPTFTPDGGEFVDFVSVAIACATEGTEIYYTLVDPNAEEDAEDNTENGADDPIAPMALNEATLYSAPFELRETTKVEAYAQLKDVTDEFGAAVKSNVVTALFTIKEGGNAIDQVELTALVYSNNGMIYVQTEAGNMIEVFTVQGQCIYASEATSDVTAINALNAEVLLVKVNNSTVKVSVR